MALLISCWSRLAQQVRTLSEILQINDRNSVHILLQSTPDSIINGIYVLLLAIEFNRRFIRMLNACLSKNCYITMTLDCFPIVFPVELGCFHLFYPITKLLIIFARNLHTLLKIDYISRCVIHFKCTLLLEDIIS